jgi:protein-L-isoaspartate(D-aspartate) O-methyltransferase
VEIGRPAVSGHGGGPAAPAVGTDDHSAAERHRELLIEQLRADGSVRSDEVEAALRAVPRHLFLPGTPLESAYANDVVVAKRDAGSVPISSASQPSMVARMLEQLQVAPGTTRRCWRTWPAPRDASPPWTWTRTS